MNVLVVMAYTDDYTVGILCEEINRHYCEQHGHGFLSKVLPCEEMLEVISPKHHFTWYKIHLLKELMQNIMTNNGYYEDLTQTPPISRRKIDYLFWIDSDACIIDSHRTIEDILNQSHYKNFIIAEDLHPCCLINAGVFLISISEWSLQFLDDIWNTKKYDKVFYYEQSAIMKTLQKYKEGLEKVQPFHSFVKNGNKEIKYFKNVAVFPHHLFSSNCVINKQEVEQYLLKKASFTSSEEKEALNEEEQMVTEEDVEESNKSEGVESTSNFPFIYHAAGVKNKLGCLRAVIEKFRLPLPVDIAVDELVFHLRRSKLGHYIPPDEDPAVHRK